MNGATEQPASRMYVRAEHALDETRRLQRCIRDLTSLLALPAIWSGGDASHVVRTLIDTLFGMLRLDFIYARFTTSANDAPIQMVRIDVREFAARPEEIGHALHHWLEEEPSKWPRSVKDPFGDNDISILPLRLGLIGQFGVIVAGSRRADFPEETERLVLSVAANQAAIGLEQARRLSGAEQALSASRRDLEMMIDTIPALVWSTRADGSVDFVNQHYLDYVGLSPERVRNWGWTTAVHPDDLGDLMAIWRSLIASGKGGEMEARFRRADGEYRWLLARTNPLHDGNGNIVKWYGLNTDIEDRKRAEIHLAGEKRVLEMIASGRPLREVLDALCRFFVGAAPDCHCGVYPIDWRGKTFQYGVAPSLPASYTDPIEGAPVAFDDSPRGRSISERTQVIAEDIGSDPRWMAAPCRAHVLEHGLRAIWSTPICSREGVVIGTVCVYQQKPGSPSLHHQELIAHVARLASIAIERSQTETALRLSEFFLTEGQRISVTGTFSWQVDTDEFMFSEELRRIFEFEANTEPNFDSIRERTHPDDLPHLAHNMARVRAGLDNPDYEIRLQMPDGRVKWMRVLARVSRREDGRLECLGAIQDVTQRRLAEQARDKVRSELAHVSRVFSLGALTASIAHEVNQPLASIVTSGETGLRWLDQQEPSFEKVQQVLKRVVNDARRAAGVIDRIRTMASKGAPKQSETALTEIITESTALLHHEFQSRDVSILLDLASHLPRVMVDRIQLQQVIVNLVINAVQAMTKSEVAYKRIAIRTQQIDAETVCCIVEDSGSGIDAEHLPHLFDSFFTTKETGMGLGLPIARSIVEAHNGRIRADNESALGGARFIFELPVNPPSSDEVCGAATASVFDTSRPLLH